MRPAGSILLPVLLALPSRASGQAAPPAPEPGAALTVSVMTFGPGREVWERFGHNAIWIHDPVHGTDQTYNYGLFDFRQENFILRFVRGQMWYWMAGFPAESYIRQYERDNRSVYVQELNLPPAARLELQQFLKWNERPEHKFYHYDYYRDNCSTRVRDALDRVVGGAIRRQTATLAAGTSFRFHTQRLTSNDPLIFTGLLLALGERVDRPITVWQEMFLPLAMRSHLRRVTITDAAGQPVPLVKSERTIFESTAPPPPVSPPRWLSWYLALGTGLGMAIWMSGRGLGGGRGRRGVFLALAGSWCLVAGLAGLILAGLWTLTDHAMAACNENLLQVNPLSLCLLPLLPTRWKSQNPSLWAGRIGGAVALVSGAGLALHLLPWFSQSNGPIIALALPAHLGLAAVLLRRR